VSADQLAGAQVLARIDSARFYDRPEAYRAEVRAWLRANGVDPWMIPAGPDARDVLVVVLDAPAIVREETVVDEDGDKRYDTGTLGVMVRTVHSLLRVPLPDHLADPL
jgi:hypothetical protein